MRVSVALLLLAVAVAVSEPINRFKREPQRIVGGSITTINVYPFAAALLYSSNGITYWQSCGGAIINNRSILSAAHCFVGDSPNNWRIRVGSSYASSGGVVHFTQLIIMHNQYSANNQNNDVALLRSQTNFAFSNTVAAVSIAGSNYNLGDNQVVWAIGWGTISFQGPASEQLRHVQVWSVNQNTCVQRYAELNMMVNNNMLCSGWLDVGGRDQCQGDSGGPLLHNNVVVGVCSWGAQCALPRYPGVNARVSQYTSWIQSNA